MTKPFAAAKPDSRFERGNEIASPQPPVETDAIQIAKPARVAAGFTSLIKAAEITLQEPGLVRGIKALRQLNPFEGIDCPGCAWPDPDEERSINEYCENGVKAIAEEATAKRITPDFFRQWSIAGLSRQSDHWFGHQGRLTHPMVRLAGSRHYQRISWADGFAMIAQTLNALASPNEAIFYTSGRTSNEAAFLCQLFVRCWCRSAAWR